MNAEDIQKAETAADGLYDRERNLAAIVVICDLEKGEMRVMSRTPTRPLIALLLATAAAEAATGRGTTLTIEVDEVAK